MELEKQYREIEHLRTIHPHNKRLIEEQEFVYHEIRRRRTIELIKSQEADSDMPNELEEVSNRAAPPPISLDAIPMHPVLAGIHINRVIQPSTLGLLIFNETHLPWKMVSLSKHLHDQDFSRVEIKWDDGRAANEKLKESHEDRELRYLVSGLLNLTDWSDAHLLERSEGGVLVGIPPGWRNMLGQYCKPRYQEGFPFNRVAWLAQDGSLRCTCAQAAPVQGQRIKDIREWSDAFQQRNTLLCPHKQILKLMLAADLLDGREEETITWQRQS